VLGWTQTGYADKVRASQAHYGIASTPRPGRSAGPVVVTGPDDTDPPPAWGAPLTEPAPTVVAAAAEALT